MNKKRKNSDVKGRLVFSTFKSKRRWMVLLLALLVMKLFAASNGLPKVNAQTILAQGSRGKESANLVALDEPTRAKDGVSLIPQAQTPGPELCQQACQGDPNCQAWTYVKPNLQGPYARCWLKDSVPQARSHDCCTSGVKAAGSVEPNVDRMGGDYRSFDILPEDHSITVLALNPWSPATLNFNKEVHVSFRYATVEQEGVRIFVRPLANDTVPPNYGAHESPLYPAGNGHGSGTFTIHTADVSVDQIRVRMWNADQTRLLFESFIPVNYHFTDLVNNITLSEADRWLDSYCAGDIVCKTGDFNNDNRKDVVQFLRDWSGEPNRGDVYVSLADANGFLTSSRLWHDWFCINLEVCEVGDFDGNGRTDAITFLRDTQSGERRGDVYVALSDGSRFTPSTPAPLWHNWLCIREEVCAVGDVDGDGRDDVIVFIRETPDRNTPYRPGTVAVALSTGSNFTSATPPIWQHDFCRGNEECFVGNFNGTDNDGRSRDDIIVVRGDNTFGSLSTNSGFGPIRYLGPTPCVANAGRLVGGICRIRIDDYNHDGQDDLLAIRSADQNSDCGRVYISLANHGRYLPPYDTGERFCKSR